MQEYNNDTPPVDTLAEILYALMSEKYESGGIFTIGGIDGSYMIKTPFNTECEYSVVAVTSSNSTAGSFTLSSSNPSIKVPSATASNMGAVATGGQGNPFDGIMGWVSASVPATYSNIWLPLGRGGNIYFIVAPGASHSILAQIAFRRSYLHAIPDVPRQHYNTHNMVTSRRALRLVPDKSKLVSGFANQYPTLDRGQETYNHSDIPYQQDPQNNNPLTPRPTGRRAYRHR